MISPILTLALVFGPAIHAQTPLNLDESFRLSQGQAVAVHSSFAASQQNASLAQQIQASADQAQSLANQTNVVKGNLAEIKKEILWQQFLRIAPIPGAPNSISTKIGQENTDLEQLAKDVDTLQKTAESLYFQTVQSPVLAAPAQNLLDNSNKLLANAFDLEDESQNDATIFTNAGLTFEGGEFEIDAENIRFSADTLTNSDSELLSLCAATGNPRDCPLKAPDSNN